MVSLSSWISGDAFDTWGWRVPFLFAIPLALIGMLPPWAAGLGMATSSLWVVGNALRLRRDV